MSVIDEFHDIIIVIGTGHTHLVNPPARLMRLLGDCDDSLDEWSDGNIDPKNSIPKKEGVYVADLLFCYVPGYYEGAYAPAESDWWLELHRVQRIKIPKPEYIPPSSDVFMVMSAPEFSLTAGKWRDDAATVHAICPNPRMAEDVLKTIMEEEQKASLGKRKYRVKRMPVLVETPADIKGDLYG